MISLTSKPKGHALSLTDIWPAGLAAAGMLVVSLGLYALSVPGETEGELAAMEAQLKSLQASARAPGDVQAFPAGSVCGGTLFAGYKDQLGLALGGSGLEVTTLDIAPPQATDTGTVLQAYAVSIKASGPYEAMVNGLNGLSKFRPTLFLDSVSVRNKTDAVELDLKGRVFCR